MLKFIEVCQSFPKGRKDVAFMGRLSRLPRTALVCLGLLFFSVTGASALDLGIGTVTGDGLRLRSEPNTDAAVLATAAVGDHALVLSDVGNGWYKVDYHCVEGYMSAQYISLSTQADISLGYGLVQAEGGTLNLRSGPGTGHGRVGSLPDGAVVTLLGIDAGWFKVESDGVTGYASSDYLVPCKDSAGSREEAEPLLPPDIIPPDVVPAVQPDAVPVSPLGWQVPIVAEWFLGIPYVWGGSSPDGFDCSGFTHYVFGLFDRELNRTASSQLENGVPVSRSELLPGDLIFFYNGQVSTPVSHVGIYVGEGRFIHASTNSYRVQYDSLESNYYSNTYVYARRIF